MGQTNMIIDSSLTEILLLPVTIAKISLLSFASLSREMSHNLLDTSAVPRVQSRDFATFSGVFGICSESWSY